LWRLNTRMTITIRDIATSEVNILDVRAGSTFLYTAFDGQRLFGILSADGTKVVTLDSNGAVDSYDVNPVQRLANFRYVTVLDIEVGIAI
jgi:hypothetical protein